MSGLVVVDGEGRLAGMLTRRDVLLQTDPLTPVSALMTPRARLVVGTRRRLPDEALRLRRRARREAAAGGRGRPGSWASSRCATCCNARSARRRPRTTAAGLAVGAAIGVRGTWSNGPRPSRRPAPTCWSWTSPTATPSMRSRRSPACARGDRRPHRRRRRQRGDCRGRARPGRGGRRRREGGRRAGARSAPRGSSPASACPSSPSSWSVPRRALPEGVPVIADGGVRSGATWPRRSPRGRRASWSGTCSPGRPRAPATSSAATVPGSRSSGGWRPRRLRRRGVRLRARGHRVHPGGPGGR